MTETEKTQLEELAKKAFGLCEKGHFDLCNDISGWTDHSLNLAFFMFAFFGFLIGVAYAWFKEQ